MANAYGSYKNSHGEEFSLSLDIDLKTEVVRDFFSKGFANSKSNSKYSEEIEELKSLVLGKTLSEIFLLKRSDLKKETLLPNGKKSITSLGLWLLHSAIFNYLGMDSTLSPQNDILCLCFGVSKRDLKKEILGNSSFDLPELIATTKATSACGSCLSLIKKTITELRLEHGLIKGLDHSKTRLDNAGHWIKIKDLYPAELVVMLDDLKNIWMKREGIVDQFAIEIENIEGHHLWLSVKSKKGEQEDRHRFEKILLALSDYWKSESGILFFLHLVE